MKNTHKKPKPAGYFHNSGKPLTDAEFTKLYGNSNRKVRRRLDAMMRHGISVAPSGKNVP